MDLEVRNAVAVAVAFDDREVVGLAGIIDFLEMHFTFDMVEIGLADVLESLIAGLRTIGVDVEHIDLVLTVFEIGDDIACRSGLAGFYNEVEIEHVLAKPAGHGIAAFATSQHIVAVAAEKPIGIAEAKNEIELSVPVRVSLPAVPVIL